MTLGKCQGHKHTEFSKEVDWVLLQPGGGHIEMNAIKAFVELTWDVFWREVVMLFNFKSDIALKCAKKVTDHHKRVDYM